MKKCPNCKKKFVSQYLLDKHLNREIPCNQEIHCDKCGRIFEKKQDMERHMKRKIPCLTEKQSKKILQLEAEKEKTNREIIKEQEKTKREEARMQKELEKMKLKAELDIKRMEKESELKQKQIDLIKQKNLEIEQRKTERKGSISDCCYVITNDVYEQNNMFKFGRTSSSQKELISCYSRGLPNPKILLFYQTNTATQDEANILTHFKEYRIDGPNRKSEWLKIEFGILKEYLDDYFEISTSYENFIDV
jgi:hypothetical protein